MQGASRLKRVPSGVRETSDCPKATRFTSCDTYTTRPWQLYMAGLPVPVAWVQYRITIGWHTVVNSRRFTGVVHVKVLGARGTLIPGLALTVTAKCGGSCTVTGTASGPLWLPGQEWGGTFTFNDAVAEDKKDEIKAEFLETAKHPVLRTGPGDLYAGSIVRCDDTMGNQNAGCIIKQYTPTMTSMTELPTIAKNILRIQAATGLGKVGGTPLTRLRNDSAIDKNRRAVCGRSNTGDPQNPGDTCDEYPFASTYEGGVPVRNGENMWAWVPGDENQGQSWRINNFYTANRILDTDPFWVKV
ncbi:NucA/NucB deoxyribonuclease domain-containing protein [Peterkaempfera sp. SMS 1(5)a]|uniref:NucA/NucB deoxyribonuclease domain-containing protein n=1 Tax=Peterkaempfera podocarpi TaxID=3232308 RepID=UPI00366ADC25